MEILNIILLLVVFVLFTTYWVGVTIQYGVLKSISVSDIWLKKPWKLMFEVTMWGSGGIMGYIGFISQAWFLLVAGIGIFLVGIFPLANSKEKWFRTTHMICAVIGVASGAISLWVDFGYWELTTIMALAVFGIWCFFEKKGKILFIEVLSFYIIWGGVFLNTIIN